MEQVSTATIANVTEVTRVEALPTAEHAGWSVGSDSYARQVVQAYVAQLADVGVVEWARSRGFSQLAAHVEQLRAA